MTANPSTAKPKRPRSKAPCPCCRHSERARIELARAAGVSLDKIGKQFGVSRDSVWRHWRMCVRPETKAELVAGPTTLAELAKKAGEENISIVESLSIVRSRLMRNFLVASDAGDANATGVLSGRLLETLRDAGRLTGEIARLAPVHNTVVLNNATIIESPQWARM